MRIRTIGTIALSALAVSACGTAGGHAAAELRPASPINLSIYISNGRISVSPSAIGAGQVVFIVTNQSSRAESVAISDSNSQTLATTAPINPQGTTQVSVNLTPGAYTLAISPKGQSDAALSQGSPIRSASIHVGRERPSSSNQLLQP